eukprot:c17282_g1_i1 orf=786-1931(+)
MGIDPVTHKPKMDASSVSDSKCNISSALSHMAQWESARLEAEARLSRESTLRSKGLWLTADVPSVAVASPKSWDNLSCDLSCKPDTGCSAISSLNKSDISVELMNWQESLQGQAGFLWPRISPTPTFAGAGNISASSSCNSAPFEQSELHSPPPTFCSLETHQQNLFQEGILSNTGKLSWDDRLLSKDSVSTLEHLLKGESALEGANLRSDECDHPEEVVNKCETALIENDMSLTSLQDLLFADEDGGSTHYPPSSPWPDLSSHENRSTDASNQNVSPLSSMNSAKEHLISREMEPTAQSVLVSSCLSSMRISSELLTELTHSSRFNPGKTSQSCAAQHACSAFFSEMKMEEISDYWINMLNQLIEFPSTHFTSSGGTTPI